MAELERPRETTNAPLPRTPLAAPEGDPLRTRVTWLLVFRAVVITTLLATAIALRATSTESLFERAALVLYAVAAVSYLSILAGGLWLKLWPQRGIRQLAYTQLAFDALAAAVLIMMTGGVESVFVFVFTLTVLNAAAVLQKQGARTLAAVVAMLYAAVLAFETTGLLLPLGLERPPQVLAVLPQFLTNTASFALVAVLAGYLTEQIARTTERLDVAKAQIERLEVLYGAVLESLPSGVLTVDAEDRVVYVNEAGAEILGTDKEQLTGHRLSERAPTLELRAQEGERFERTAHIEGRGDRTIGGSTAALTGLAELPGRVVVFQDLTELRRLQGDVARAERLAELGRFAAGLAHEIRNPLAAMIGCLQLLRTDSQARATDDESTRMLAIVHREAERLSGLVSEFLTYARPSTPHIADIDLVPIVDETLATARQDADGIVIERAGEGAADVAIAARCDADQLRQVLWNLVRNAVQAVRATKASGGRVQLALTSDEGGVLLMVDDDGPGVPDEIRPRIFEPFFTTRPEGTGLGLATVHQLVAQMGGWIAVQTSPLGGARFVVRLQRASVSGRSTAAG
jgi:two-component system, NtrC family, sensor histidine kinase PilS